MIQTKNMAEKANPSPESAEPAAAEPDPQIIEPDPNGENSFFPHENFLAEGGAG